MDKGHPFYRCSLTPETQTVSLTPLREVGRFTKAHSLSAGAQAQMPPPAMHCPRLALGLGFCLLLGITLYSLW